MDGNADNPESLSWYAQILVEVADTLLDSPDITQALAQAQTDPSALRKIVISNSDYLMSAGTTPELAFVDRIEWELFLPRRLVRYAVPVCLFILVLSFTGLANTKSLSNVILSVIILIFLAIAVICAMILSGARIIEPVNTTKDDLRREVVGPFLREQINRILGAQEHSDVMRITAAPGLADLSDREQLVITDNINETLQLCKSMSSGSIGISGPRGVGKTTLLRYFCDPLLDVSANERSGGFRGFSDLRIFISAPVEFNTKDFILHLFGKLCHAVIGGDQNLDRDGSYRRKDRPRGRLAVLIVACILVICGLGLIGYAFYGSKHVPGLTRLDIFLGAGALSLVTGTGILIRWIIFRWSVRGFSPETLPLIDEAKAWLVRIGYLQTLTSGYTGSFKIPAGLELGVTSGRQMSELELTLPDLIDRYKTFAERAIDSRRRFGNQLLIIRESREQYARVLDRRAALLHKVAQSAETKAFVSRLSGMIAKGEELFRRQAAGVRETLVAVPEQYDYGPKIMIGIDEIDKIDIESARRFLNDIKAIFGVPNCLYLVSVSDEALAMFQQRVLLGRTAFDSSFDEVARVRELDFVSCRYLLRRRIAGMPDSLIAFCEIMSGGLPRDLIRMARAVVEVSAAGEKRIEDLTLAVINDQVEILRRAAITEIVGNATQYSEDIFWESLLHNDSLDGSAQSILTLLDGAAKASFPISVNAALYFYATVAEIFGSQTPNSQIFLDGYRLATTEWIDRLARARNMISINGELAWEMIGYFRTTVDMSLISKPEPQS
jgi:hypothetical protein